MGEYLLVTVQVDMHDRLAMALQDDLTEKIVATHARGVLIDISALDLVDSFIGRMLGNIAFMSRILDARTVVVGSSGGRHYPCRTGISASGCSDRAQRRKGNGRCPRGGERPTIPGIGGGK